MFRERHYGGMAEVAIRQPQQERSRATQQRLLDATVDCLVAHGWSGTTTTLVATRAGVSEARSFTITPPKPLSSWPPSNTSPTSGRRRSGPRPPRCHGAKRLDKVVDMLATAFTGPLFTAALELWVAARTDAELREALVPLEARVGRELHRLTAELLDADEQRTGVREAIQTTLDLLRGLGVANLLTDDAARRNALLKQWKHHLAETLEQ